MIDNEKFEWFQTQLIAAAKNRAGSWANLARALPISPSHLSLIKNAKSKAGPDILCRLLEYLELLPQLENMLNEAINADCSNKSV